MSKINSTFVQQAAPDPFIIAKRAVSRLSEPAHHVHRTKLAAAAAAARSGLPFAPRCPVLTLVNVDVDKEADATMAACDARLAV